MNDKRTFTPAQERLIEKYRDCNVDHDWWDSTYDDFKSVAKAFGFDDVEMEFSGFWSQGDGASFTFEYVDAYSVILKAIEVEQSKEFGEVPTGYAAEFASLGALLLDTFNPYVLTCPEGREIAEAYRFKGERRSNHYSHARTVRVEVCFEDNEIHGNPPLTDQMQQVWNVLSPKIWVSGGDDLEKAIDEAVEAIANALYRTLESEHDYLTSDEQVWEAIEANGWDKDEEDEEEDEELEMAA